jgi:hypothetical protein
MSAFQIGVATRPSTTMLQGRAVKRPTTRRTSNRGDSPPALAPDNPASQVVDVTAARASASEGTFPPASGMNPLMRSDEAWPDER